LGQGLALARDEDGALGLRGGDGDVGEQLDGAPEVAADLEGVADVTRLGALAGGRGGGRVCGAGGRRRRGGRGGVVGLRRDAGRAAGGQQRGGERSREEETG